MFNIYMENSGLHYESFTRKNNPIPMRILRIQKNTVFDFLRHGLHNGVKKYQAKAIKYNRK